MAIRDGQRLRITAYDDSGTEVGFRVRVVTLTDGRSGCAPPRELVRLVERDPRVRVEGSDAARAEVVRSGRAFAEVHGRLRRIRWFPHRPHAGPVLLIRPE